MIVIASASVPRDEIFTVDEFIADPIFHSAKFFLPRSWASLRAEVKFNALFGLKTEKSSGNLLTASKMGIYSPLV